MILKGNQRGGGQQLAAHLLNSFDNERVEVADLRGSVAQDLSGAFAEWNAQAGATKCRKYLYSLSLNPDQSQGHLTREQYLELLERTERSLKLVGQPRAVVFHDKRDKDGVPREHCHAVWSRIDTDKMRAVQMAHDRLKLRSVAREFALDHGLALPDGMKRDGSRDRFNDRARQENLGERQQKERTGISKAERMADITRCWKETSNGTAFVKALEATGYSLARGDRRAYVVVDLNGEVHSLARQIEGANTKALKQRLADFPVDKLHDIEAARAWAKKQRDEYDKQKQDREPSEVEKRRAALQERQQQRRQEIGKRRNDMLARHGTEREGLRQMQDARNTGVISARLAKQPKGVLAFLTLITGIKMITEARQRLQDTRRAEEQKKETQALARRHERELKAMDRHDEALERIEGRENRAAVTALKREKFQKTAALLHDAHALKPEFDRAADPEKAEKKTGDGGESAKGRVAALFNRKAKTFSKGDLQHAFEQAKDVTRKPASSSGQQEHTEEINPEKLEQAEKAKAELERRQREREQDRKDRGPDRDDRGR